LPSRDLTATFYLVGRYLNWIIQMAVTKRNITPRVAKRASGVVKPASTKAVAKDRSKAARTRQTSEAASSPSHSSKLTKSLKPTSPTRPPRKPRAQAESYAKSSTERLLSHTEIALRAWEIWQSEGCPDGRSLEHWRRAEQELSTIL